VAELARLIAEGFTPESAITGASTILCDRCGGEADVDWVDVRAFGDPGARLAMGRSACRRYGCVDEYGSRAVEPPDEPGQLTREDRRWLRRQRMFLAEYERVSREFAAIEI
jgi:hypothetical protein